MSTNKANKERKGDSWNRDWTQMISFDPVVQACLKPMDYPNLQTNKLFPLIQLWVSILSLEAK